MIREIDHGKPLTAALQLLVERSEEIVGLGDAVQIAGDLFAIDKGFITAMSAFTSLGMRTNQMIHHQLGSIRGISERLIGKLQQIHILGIF